MLCRLLEARSLSCGVHQLSAIVAGSACSSRAQPRGALTCLAASKAMKWYAVRQGRCPGVYQSWGEVEQHTKGVSGAQYKSFKSKREAESWLHESQGAGEAGQPAATRYYGIRHPVNVAGVYTSWAEVHPLVTGVSGASFKGNFKTSSEAEAWVREAGIPIPAPSPAPQSLHPQPAPTAEARSAASSQQAHTPPAYHIQADPQGHPTPQHVLSADECCYLEFDGGSRGNPGPSGFGSVLRSSSGKLIQVVAGMTIKPTTNNQAEYAGLIQGLKAAKALGVRRLWVQGDSELIVRQLLGRYKASEKGGLIQPLAEAKALLATFAEHHVKHVLRADNTDADLLGNLAMDVLMLKKSEPSSDKQPAAKADMLQHLQASAKPCMDGVAASNGDPQREHVGGLLRARVLEGLLQQQEGADSRVVVIDLATFHRGSEPAQAAEGSGKKRSSSSSSSSSSNEKKKGKVQL